MRHDQTGAGVRRGHLIDFERIAVSAPSVGSAASPRLAASSRGAGPATGAHATPSNDPTR